MDVLNDSDTTVISLSTKDVTTTANIKCFEQILEQTKRFKEIIITNRKIKTNCNVVGFCITESTATSLEQLNIIKPIIDQIEL